MMPMAKKKSHKKQSFKYAQPTIVADSSVSPAANPFAPKGSSPGLTKPMSNVISIANNDNPYLGQDLRRLGIIAVSLFVLMFGLWALISNTPLGDTVYNLYKVNP